MRRGVLTRVARRVSGAQAAEDLMAVYARLDAIEAELARQRQTLVRFAELHGDAMQRIGDELIALRRSRPPDGDAE